MIRKNVGKVKVKFVEDVYFVIWCIDGFFCYEFGGEVFKSDDVLLWSTFTFEVAIKKYTISLSLYSPLRKRCNAMFYILGVLKEDGSLFRKSANVQETIKDQFEYFEWHELSRGEFIDLKHEIVPNGKVTFIAAIGNQSTLEIYNLLLGYTKGEKTLKFLFEDEEHVNEDKKDRNEEEKKCFNCNDMNDLSVSFEELYLNEKNCDVILKVKEREYKVHRIILSARSVVFASMFEHSMKESVSGVVEIPDCDPDAFHDFLLYLYAGRVEKFSKNIVDLHFMADKYDVKPLVNHCIRYMTDNISVDSFCDFLSLAVKHNEPNLINAIEKFFSQNVNTILVTQTWQSFIKENPIIANELFIKHVNQTD